jgi:hypothetical protein
LQPPTTTAVLPGEATAPDGGDMAATLSRSKEARSCGKRAARGASECRGRSGGGGAGEGVEGKEERVWRGRGGAGGDSEVAAEGVALVGGGLGLNAQEEDAFSSFSCGPSRKRMQPAVTPHE